MARRRVHLSATAEWRRHGAPTQWQPVGDGPVGAHEWCNTDPTEPGRIQGRPTWRDLYEKGSSGDTKWPRFRGSAT